MLAICKTYSDIEDSHECSFKSGQYLWIHVEKYLRVGWMDKQMDGLTNLWLYASPSASVHKKLLRIHVKEDNILEHNTYMTENLEDRLWNTYVCASTDDEIHFFLSSLSLVITRGWVSILH